MSNTTKAAYFMVQIKARNFGELLEHHGRFAIPMLAKFGREMIAGSPAPKLLEGDWDGNWAAVLRFPSMESAEAWYDSAEYRPLRDLRINQLTDGGRVMLLEAFESTALAG
jgi:uncharacterized protein (DUF1330 family)